MNENIIEILYTKDKNKIREAILPIIKHNLQFNQQRIDIGDFTIEMNQSDINVSYNGLNGFVEYSKMGSFKKTDNIIDENLYAISVEDKNDYELNTPMIKVISSIEMLDKEIYETHIIDLYNSDIVPSSLVKNPDYIDIDESNKCLISRDINLNDKRTYPEYFLNMEYLKPIRYNEINNKYEKYEITRKEEDYKEYVITLIDEEIIISLIYQIILEYFLNK